MPQYLGGDIVEFVCKHPTLGEFRFQVKSNETVNIDPGGYRANDDANAVTGGGSNIKQINRVRWSIEGPVSVDPLSENESKNLPLLAESPADGTWILTHISGKIWKGLGSPVGDLIVDLNTAQIPLKVSGGGRLEGL